MAMADSGVLEWVEDLFSCDLQHLGLASDIR
jgi:hypothetical protein